MGLPGPIEIILSPASWLGRKSGQAFYKFNSIPDATSKVLKEIYEPMADEASRNYAISLAIIPKETITKSLKDPFNLAAETIDIATSIISPLAGMGVTAVREAVETPYKERDLHLALP